MHLLRRRHNYGLVLLLVGASIVFQMQSSDSDLARFVTVLLQATTLVVVVWATEAQRRGVRAAAFVALGAAAAALCTWIVRGDLPPAPVAVANGLLVVIGPFVIAAGLLRLLQEEQAVSAQTLSGVLAIYLLAGMVFSFAYGVIGAVDPGSLFEGRGAGTTSDQLYFSFVTLSTVGYGDFAPLSDLARTLAVAEMLAGQIYLVTIVALIVTNLRRRRD